MEQFSIYLLCTLINTVDCVITSYSIHYTKLYDVQFIPGAALDASVFEHLRPGDYLGLYSPDPGLDVTHVGIVVRVGGRLMLRHASSRQAERRVVDSDLANYLAGKPGIVVLRPQPLPPP